MDKAEIREIYKTKRMHLSPKELEDRSIAVVQHFFTKFDVIDKTVSLFLPIEKQKEINTYLLLEKAMDFGAKIVLSRSNFESGTMRHFLYEESDGLELNSFGIPEPKKGKPISPDKIDLVIVPLLAIDEKGHRVGYGRGFYDRFLAKCNPNCQFVGLSLFNEFVEISNLDRTDVSLNSFVSPAGIHRF